MRGIIGLVLAGLGAFLILVAVLLPTWVVGQVIKFPLNYYQPLTLLATNATYFSPTALHEMTGVTIEDTLTFKGDGSAGTSSTAVWNDFSYIYDLTNHKEFQLLARRFAFDRRSAQLVTCCDVNVNGNTAVNQVGVVGYVFPIGTQKQTYQVFDATLGRAVPVVYSGTANVDGISAYMFTENYTSQVLGSTPFPGALVGSKSPAVTATEYGSLHQIYYIDPVTGVLIDTNQHQTITVRNVATGATAAVLFNADLVMQPASVRALVSTSNSGRDKITVLSVILPIACGALGAILLAVGLFLSRRRRDDVTPADSAASAVTEAPRGHHESRPAGLTPGPDGAGQVPSATEAPPGADGPGTRDG